MSRWLSLAQHKNLRALYLRLGLIPPDTEFNRRAAAYTARAVKQADNNARWKRIREQKNADQAGKCEAASKGLEN